MIYRPWACVIVLCVIGVGCSSGGKHASSSNASASSTASPDTSARVTTSSIAASTSTTRRATTTSVPVNPTADATIARSGLLQLADLPAGWSAHAHAPSTNPALDARIARCLGVDLTLVNTDLQPHADSQDFTGPAGQQIQSGVAVFANATTPTDWIATYATPKAVSCLATTLGGPGIALHGQLLPLARIADGAVALRFSAGATIDALFARRGRALAYLVVQTPTGIDEANLLTKMTLRLTAAA
jgi:hypothetical protein